MKVKVTGWAKANSQFRSPCSKKLKIKLFKKLTPAQKKRMNNCIARKARAAGMKVDVPDPRKGILWSPWR